MKTMAVAWNGTTLNDKVKLLSVTELGITNGNAVTGEGNRYYVYGPHIKNMVIYWSRTRSMNNSSAILAVSDTGGFGNYAYYNAYCLAPVIRLG